MAKISNICELQYKGERQISNVNSAQSLYCMFLAFLYIKFPFVKFGYCPTPYWSASVFSIDKEKIKHR